LPLWSRSHSPSVKSARGQRRKEAPIFQAPRLLWKHCSFAGAGSSGVWASGAIGFTKTTAEGFFSRLSKAKVKKLIDVRLNNVSQLAGFAKKDDLKFFTNTICNAGYEHIPELAPTQGMLDEYKKSKGTWSAYARKVSEFNGAA
jgi:hypothetical protein